MGVKKHIYIKPYRPSRSNLLRDDDGGRPLRPDERGPVQRSVGGVLLLHLLSDLTNMRHAELADWLVSYLS